MLIAALGGEGGGVLTQWIVSAAAQAGFPVQSTSIPGVAQRTGATTYYVEILPTRIADLNGKRPVLALTPGVGDIDIAVASELLESGRTVANGFVTPDRTHVISSLSRFYAMDEKIAMGDGRFDQDKLIKLINEHAKDALLVDMDALAKQSGSIINAVMLGAIAGCGRLPLRLEQFEAAIREDGKAVDSNLKGFRAGYDAARAKLQPAKLSEKKSKAAATPAFVEHEVARTFPAVAQATDSKAYGALSTTRMSPMAGFISIACGPVIADDQAMGAQGKLLKEVARHLAVRMSYEGRRPCSRGQDRAGPHAAHCARGAAAEWRAVFRSRLFSSPALKNFANCFHRSWRGPSCKWRSAKDGLAGFISDGDQFHIDQRLPALLAARQAPRPAALWSSLQAGTATNRRLAPADPRGGETVRRAWHWKSPSAHG
jgi:Pyruvate/2-oxoacid:ferredoxin oxidoreductase gamma subunit